MDCMVKTIKFPSKNQQVLNSSLATAVGKTVTVKNLNKPEILKLFLKSKVKDKESKWNKPESNTNHSHTRISRLARYIYQSSCLGYRWWLPGPLFQKTGTKRGINGLLRFTLSWLTIHYTQKH